MAACQTVMTRIFLLLVFMVLLPEPLHAVNPAGNSAAEFDRGNKLYEQGHFAEAAAVYNGLVKSGIQTPSVWFNLGNAAYKSGALGAAIVAYRMAERQTPRDSSLRANLQFVRSKIYSDERARVPWRAQLVRLATTDEWTVLSATLLWILFGLLVAGELKGRHYPKQVVTVCILLALSGIALGLAFYDQAIPQAVVTAREATVRRGPLDESQAAFQLSDGAEVRVLAFKEDWIQVRDLEKRTGWVRRDALSLLPSRSWRIG